MEQCEQFFKTVNAYNEDSKMDVVFYDAIKDNMEQLNCFVTFLYDNKFRFTQQYLEKLENKFTQLGNMSCDQSDVQNIFEKLEWYQQYPSLFAAAVNSYLTFCGFINYNPKSLHEKTSVYKRDYLKGFLLVRYHELIIISEFMPKNEALQFIQKFTDYHTIKRRVPEHVESVDELIVTEEWPVHFQESFNFTKFKFAEGVVGIKITKCRWCNTLKDLGDPDFLYAMLCYYDFLAASMMNENFVLTRNHTLAQNKTCCDFVWHDKRLDPNPQHPKKDFWDKLPA